VSAHELTICSSSKYYDVVRTVTGHLAERGITVNTPRFDFNEQFVEVTPEQKRELTHEFLEKIRRSAAIYILAADGYTGRSVCIETGFAAALGLPVYISEPPAEAAIAALVTDVVGTTDAPDFLAKALTDGR
jgi:nucleoside 2-deoxyribosyltransferase